jgi:hypothetical protein
MSFCRPRHLTPASLAAGRADAADAQKPTGSRTVHGKTRVLPDAGALLAVPCNFADPCGYGEPHPYILPHAGLVPGLGPGQPLPGAPAGCENKAENLQKLNELNLADLFPSTNWGGGPMPTFRQTIRDNRTASLRPKGGYDRLSFGSFGPRDGCPIVAFVGESGVF